MWDQTGSVAVVVALILTLLLSVMAFTMDTGYLYIKKNQYQNAVEAAAMAGAVSLCDENPENAARKIAIENITGLESGLEEGEAVLTIQTGFYDENDTYADFSTYKDFVASDDPAFPGGEHNNAVLVSLAVENSGLTGMMPLPKDSDESTVTIRTAAVAYLRAYGMLSLGTESDDGITFSNYAEDEPEMTNGSIHANNDISFDASPNIDSASVTITAAGNISGYGGGDSGVDPVSVKPVSAYLDDLYAKADVILSESDFPASGEITVDGNVYAREYIGNSPTFKPHIGDHEGTIYFFDDDVDVQLSNTMGNESEITNFIFAARGSIKWHASSAHDWGGENKKQVTIVAGEDIIFGGMLYSDSYFDAMGVVFLAGGDITWRNTSTHGSVSSIRYTRMIADGSIDIEGPYAMPQVHVVWSMKFGPPCPPNVVRLGRLITP